MRDKRPRPRSVVKRAGIRSASLRRWRYIVAPWDDAFWRGSYARNVWTWTGADGATYTISPGGLRAELEPLTSAERYAVLASIMPDMIRAMVADGYGSAVLESHIPVSRALTYRVAHPTTRRERRALAQWFSAVARTLDGTARQRMNGYAFLVRHNVTGGCPLFHANGWTFAVPVSVTLPHGVQRWLHRWEPK